MKAFKFAIIFSALFIGHLCQIANAQCSANEIINLRKTAIVFGEKDYKFYGPLSNTVNDANDITDSLRKLGFIVFTYIDANQRSMNDAVNSWCGKLANFDVALFYFSGHGAEVNGENFLFPTDINPKGQSELLYDAFSANKLLATLDNSHLKYSVIILDACRNNPFTRSWGRGANNGGLAQMNGKGAFIAFAASPGKTASDGINRNGTYTEGILKNIMTPNKTINDIFTGVNGYVQMVTNGEQEPFYNTSFGTNYCFSVTRSNTLVKLSRPFSTYQKDAEIALSADQTVIYTLDNSTGEITIRDTKSSNLIRTLTCSPTQTSSIVALNGFDIAAIDTVTRTISLIDWQQDKIVHEFKLPFAPIATIVLPDMKRMLILGNDKGKGFFCALDLSRDKVSDKMPLSAENSAAVTDGKFIYALSKTKKNELLVINIKTAIVVKNIPLPFQAQQLILSPEMRTLVVCDTVNGRLFAFEKNSLKPDSILDINGKSVAFTNDDKYAFIVNNRQIIILRASNGEKLNTMPFANSPKGIVLDNEGSGYVWLPNENRIHFFRLSEELKDTVINLDPEEKYKAFQKLIKSDPTLPERQRQRDLCNQLHQYAEAFYQLLANEVILEFIRGLSDIKFSVKQGTYITPYCDRGTATFTQGIQSNEDRHKYIFPTFDFQFSNSEVTLSLRDSNFDKKATSKSFPLLTEKKDNGFQNPFAVPLTEDDRKELVKFVRDYFSYHLDYLN